MKNKNEIFFKSPELTTTFCSLIIFFFCDFVPFALSWLTKKRTEVEKDIGFEIPPPISLELLRTYEGFENVSEEKGKADIYAIETFANILYSLYKQENK